MRVLLLGYFYPPDYSGEATYTAELIFGLRELGHEVMALVARTATSEGVVLPPWVHAVPEPDNVDRFVEFDRYADEFSAAMVETALHLAGRHSWDVIHVQEWYAASAALQLSKKLGLPIVKTFHFDPSDTGLATHRFQRADIAQKMSCESASVVIAVSEHMARRAVSRYQLSPSKVRMVYNGVDGRQLARLAAAPDPRTKYCLDPSRRLVLLSGA